ncbi:MAG: aminoacetone oxidase family FAD-binding enzyme [Proteobacteria bacterium]|nr:MAG: aminoacetone oxidase family FAD-binding enzyme [Pseudomonadota bacterium]
MNTNIYDVIVLGAGAAGLMCAAEAGNRGRRVLILDHAEKAGKKILISGGGRCNFTNLYASANDFLSQNPHFCKSALARFTQYDTLEMFEKQGITWHEREHGQLFCDGSAKQVVDMLLEKCAESHVTIQLCTKIDKIVKHTGFDIYSDQGVFACESLVVATGGLSIPKMGATGFGYQIARQFDLNIIETEAGLVPFRLTSQAHDSLKALAGISLPVEASCAGQSFREAMLFTHRGISGPAMLQISSYWQAGEVVGINLLPDLDVRTWLVEQKVARGKQHLRTVLADILPKRLVLHWCELYIPDKPLQSLSDADLDMIVLQLQGWQLKPAATEGYRTAEVTLGGVDTACLSSKTMQARDVEGLYFIGEVVDVTGHLGGFNFQWAWASGYCAGQFV